MIRNRSGSDLLVALWGAIGVVVVGFFGAEVLFGPGADGVELEATLLPAIAAGVGAFFYLLNQEDDDSLASPSEDEPLAPIYRLDRGAAPTARERRDAA